MKKKVAFTLVAVAAVVVAAGLFMRASASRRDAILRASLSGLNEVPPTASRASGTLRATFDEDTQMLSFTIDYQNLSGPPVVAHTHFGPTKVNGGVMFFFCGGGGKAACPAATSGTITTTVTPVDVLGPAAQGITASDFADTIRAIATGNSYANLHTAAFPAGEIRGRIFTIGLDADDGEQDE